MVFHVLVLNVQHGVNMNVSDIVFSVNEYDRDGDLVDEGIFIHLGVHRFKVGGVDELDDMVKHLQGIVEEIKSNYM